MPDDPEPFVCVECHVEAPADARGWRIYLDDNDHPVAYCPECAEREFGET